MLDKLYKNYINCPHGKNPPRKILRGKNSLIPIFFRSVFEVF